jgi:N-acetylglucosaminyl-diphospho-decaprenol L-rhamnosyltransferase
MNTIDVSAVVISLNSRHFLQGCLESLKTADWGKYSYEVLVVDNGSTDGSQAMVQSEYPWVRLIANEKNAGLCAAANQGARLANGKYYLLLNDDILILDQAIPRLIQFLDAHTDVAMIGSRLLNADGSDQFSSGRSFPSPMNALFGRKSFLTRVFPRAPWARRYLLSDQIDGQEPYEVDWLSAAAMMARRDVYLQLGGLAEDFYYFVEILFCERMKQAGHKIYLDPQSRIIHFEGVGSGIRTARVRRRHIVRFHVGAYRWYCLHRRWNPRAPQRLLAGAFLSIRAAALIAADVLKPSPKEVRRELDSGRPEGGVAI